MRIAIPAHEANWAGLMDFLRIMIGGLNELRQTNQLELFLLLPAIRYPGIAGNFRMAAKRTIKDSLQQQSLRPFRPNQEHHKGFTDFIHQIEGLSCKIIYHPASDSGLADCLSSIRADVALPLSAAPRLSLPCPFVGLLVDFQHRRLPSYFSPQECYQRDIQQAGLLLHAPVAISLSEAVKLDSLHYYPWADPTTILPLPFCPQAPSNWLEPLSDNLKQIYQLPDRYFIISNQFWRHKDHLTAFEALRLLIREQPLSDAPLGLVCTGSLHDYRSPGHGQALQNFLNEHQLDARVRLLGHIPKRHQIELIKGALALIQPTLFEGTAGGLCVHDAVAIGVPVLLSDISVNQEAKADNVSFFKAGDATDLAKAMASVLDQPPGRPGRQQLLSMAAENRRRMGEFVLEAINQAIQRHQQAARCQPVSIPNN